MFHSFEYDDYPHDRQRFLALVDYLKQQFPNFCCSVFAIPTEMKEADWLAVQTRPYLRIYPHGFRHKKRECRAEGWRENLRLLMDRRWSKVFKAPYYGYCEDILHELHDRGFAIARKRLDGWPMPMPTQWRVWDIANAQFRHTSRVHVDCHPMYGSSRNHKATKTEISHKNIVRWTRSWPQDAQFKFVSELLESACLKINIGCGPQVWPGWSCLDHRPQAGAIKWKFPERLPWSDNKADVVLTSHFMEYVAEDEYTDLLLEIWRVLRPQGVLRMSETETDSGFAWKQPGKRHVTGKIRSLPSQRKILAALQRVGFDVHETLPDETLSSHKDVLQGNTRSRHYRRGRKFYVEAVKNVEIKDFRRVHCFDIRARRRRPYRLPPLPDEVNPRICNDEI